MVTILRFLAWVCGRIVEYFFERGCYGGGVSWRWEEVEVLGFGSIFRVVLEVVV